MGLEILVGFTIQILGLVLIALLVALQGRYLARMSQKMEADDAATYLTQKQIQAALAEMPESLKKAN